MITIVKELYLCRLFVSHARINDYDFLYLYLYLCDIDVLMIFNCFKIKELLIYTTI